jgi:hypothetical protein
MAIVNVPDFAFSGFYYPEILESLLAYTRINTPELTSESEYEPHIQMLRSYSLVGHLCNTRVDVVANELLLDSILLRESLKRLYKLIDYDLASATPAVAPMLIKFSSPPLSDISPYIPKNTQWGTEQEDGEEIIYENSEDLNLNRADQISSAYMASITQGGIDGVVDTAFPQRFSSATATFAGTDVNKTILIVNSQNNNYGYYKISSIIDANTIEVTGASFVSETDLLWQVIDYGSDISSDLNDTLNTVSFAGQFALFISHENIQWNQMDFIVVPSSADKPMDIYYWDSTYSRFFPNSVAGIGGGKLEIVVNSLIAPDDIGTYTRREFLPVKVTYNPTGKSEWVITQYDGTDGNYIETKGLLGQTVVDTDVRNYTIQSDWNIVPGLDTYALDVDGEISYVLPMDTVRRWAKYTIEGNGGFWLMFISGVGTTEPTINNIRIDQGDTFFPFDVVQGVSIENEILGSSNGQAGQEFTTLQRPVFDDSYLIEVDEVGGGTTWTPYIDVKNLLNSGSTDRHYKTDLDFDDKLKAKFGNGDNGKIPPLGSDNIRISYRVGGDEDGNVGAGKITGNIDGIQFVSSVANPMPAVGWTIKEGGDEVDLERAKESGPASIRNNGKAVSPPDMPRVAVDEYRTEDGSALIERAFAIEEAYGPKTVELVVVGTGGEFLTAEQLDNLETFYNGDKYSIPPVEGVLILNHELTAVNYDPKVVDCTYLVIGKGITVEQIENALAAYLQPLAENEDGTYVHQFGGKVPTVMLDCAIKDISTSITNIHRTLPASDVTLGSRQLPNPGILTISVQETE